MKTKFIRRVAFFLIIVILVVFIWIGVKSCLKKEDEAIHIAMVGPLTGTNSYVGKSFRQGIRLYIDNINRRGGVNGKELVLDEFDDQNDKFEAEERARDIVKANKAVAVIGHHYSSCSISAGNVYDQYEIPAISPASSNVKVTDSKWYFRSSFNDNLQGKFLANFAKRITPNNAVSIIVEDDPYGAYIADVFEKTAKDLNVDVKYRWNFRVNDKELDLILSRIVGELRLKKDAGVLLLSTHANEGIKILKLIKDNFIKIPVMGPDAFASESFQKGFKDFSKEKRYPGFYTDGMYVTTPLLTDMLSEKGQKFKETYLEQYDEEPGWHAAFAYDTAMVVVEAIRNTEITGSQKTLKEDRKKIREYLSKLKDINDAIEGVTGYNYFDDKGDSQKPVYVGVYKNQQIVSGLTQFQAVPNQEEIPNLKEELEKERIVKFIDDKYSYKINVVYTGLEINEISELDIEKKTCTLGFHIWFRYQGEIDVQSIEFLNAIDDIQLGKEKPALEKKDKVNYRLYQVKDKRFRTDFLPSQYRFGHHHIGVSFRPRALNRNSLIFVKDELGMKETSGRSLTKKLKDAQVLSPIHGWTIKDVIFYQDIAEKASLGDPEYLGTVGGVLEYSRFNMAIQITKDKINFRQFIPIDYSKYIIIFSLLMTLILASWVEGKFFIRYIPIINTSPFRTRILWPFQFFFVLLFLLSSEVGLLNHWAEKLSSYYLEHLIMLFNCCWWLTTAYFLNLLALRFIWRPLEKKSGRKVPDIIRHLATLLIFTLALFGIIAFVFNERLTSLLATSGVIAMIIGLAVQMNIANIFSGIAINLERPFQVDDWIKIGSFTEGRVVDINWRATRIMTRDDTVLTIPNSQASESSIENFSYRKHIMEKKTEDNKTKMLTLIEEKSDPSVKKINDTKGYWKYTTVHVDPSHSPEYVKKILLDAARATKGISKTKPPSTRFLGLTAGITGQSESWAANYLVSVYFEDYGDKFAHNEAVWTSIWTHLKYAGIRHIMERHEVNMVFEGIHKRKEEAPIDRDTILHNIPIFKPLPNEAKAHLSNKMRRRYYPEGEIVVKQNDTGDSLFIIQEGNLRVLVKDKNDPTRSIEVARLGPGNFFGEMALLTGEPRTATIIADSDSYIFEITKNHIDPVIKKQPQISWTLSGVLSTRKMQLAGATTSQEKTREEQVKILDKIQKFFGFK